MTPTLNPSQRVFSQNWFFRLYINDLVVVQVSERKIIKRIKKLEEERVYLIGDNLKESTDSRKLGWINKTQIIGKVISIIG